MNQILIFLSLILYSFSSQAQSVMDSFSEEEMIETEQSSLISERIEKISPSKKIFIISNENQSFTDGDFISLVYQKKLTARALVAKVKGNIAGIKILKIYNLSGWKKLRKNREVKIIKGDDSYYQKQAKKKKNENDEDITEDDLFDKTIISEDLLKEDTKESVFRTDNMVSLLWGWWEGLDNRGESKRYGQLNFQWMYQVFKNLFLEIDFGFNTVKDFPSGGLDTRFYNVVPKVKYTFEVFWGFIIQPYVGWQWIIADSPGAGQPDSNTSGNETSTVQRAAEVRLVEESEASKFVFGISFVQPIVPGWNLKADLGMDILSLGVGLEF